MGAHTDCCWCRRNFSNGVPLENVETEKSRIVLKEIEADWWILAAVDLTQLPSSNRIPSTASTPKSGRNTPSNDTTSTNVEYSSREVASASLLLTQLAQAHRVFLLHHATSLSELWKKHENKRDIFCTILHRYWTRFIWNWDVLLHGNPSVELYSAIKLAGGGELGVGVGEEEWGSGEREVLEGFAARTDGLVDLIVGRYGDASPPTEDKDNKHAHIAKAPAAWLGSGQSARAEDGMIFSGVGGISRSSLTTLSHWMESIYMHGDGAYGVGENPSSHPRQHRKRRKVDKDVVQEEQAQRHIGTVHRRVKSPVAKGPDLRRRAIANTATSPGIPAPLVTAVERSLDSAIAKADKKALSDQHDGDPAASDGNNASTAERETMFNSEKMMKYLSLGYGSSWTLNPNGFNADSAPKALNDTNPENVKDNIHIAGSVAEPQLEELDPTPEVSDEDERPFVQRLEESMGKFLIGLSGDLENTEFEDESNDEGRDSAAFESGAKAREVPKRILLRTLMTEMSTSRFSEKSSPEQMSPQAGRGSAERDSPSGKTSAQASVDGSHPVITHEKVRVTVYVHRPFIFVFLFQLHTSNLTIPSFYRAIHHTLGPLQKSLLNSTDPERWRERMRGAMGLASDTPIEDGNRQSLAPETTDISEVYDLLYDPEKSTIRTSIPNIPPPGSLAAEGLHRSQPGIRPITVSGSWYTLGIPIGSSPTGSSTSLSHATTLVKSHWTRIEALNIHTHILGTWSATRDRQAGLTQARPNGEETERTVKTSRSWWIVWMTVPSPEQINCAKEAILVRRSPLERSVSTRETSRSDKWLLRDQPRTREVSGSGSSISSPGTTTAKGVTEGVGVDAKKWVDALLRLTV